MAYYIKRLADYVEVMNKIPKLEDTPVKIQTVPIDGFMKMLDDNIKLTAKEYGKDISVINKTELQEVRGDISLIFRVLENVMRNACRYLWKNYFNIQPPAFGNGADGGLDWNYS